MEYLLEIAQSLQCCLHCLNPPQKTKNKKWVVNETFYWSTKSRNSDVFCKLKWPRKSEIKRTQIYLRFLFLLLTKRKKKTIPQFCWWAVLCQLWLIGIANGALGQFVSTVILRPLPALICANTPGKIYNLFTFPLLIKSFLIVDWLYFKIVLSSYKAAGQAYTHTQDKCSCLHWVLCSSDWLSDNCPGFSCTLLFNIKKLDLPEASKALSIAYAQTDAAFWFIQAIVFTEVHWASGPVSATPHCIMRTVLGELFYTEVEKMKRRETDQ